MPLERIRVEGLRCLQDVDCDLQAKRNYIFGSNGAGKTSFLEAVYLLGRGRSFRTRQTRRLVQHHRDSLSVYAELRAAADIHRVGVSYDNGSLQYRIDRKPAAGVTDVARLLRVDVIDPSVHKLIEGGPSERRRYVDWGVFHVEPDYLTTWRRYRRILGQRNAALKQRGSPAAVAVWDDALIRAAGEVHQARSSYVNRLRPVTSDVSGTLLMQPVSISYRQGWRSDLGFPDALRESAERDRTAGYTQVGPHRADLSVTLGGSEVADEASRGQQKLVASALVLAQVRDSAGERDTALLVDDPAAELDRKALDRLLAVLEELPCQLILTGLSRDHLPVEPGFPVFHVEQGRVKKCYNDSV